MDRLERVALRLGNVVQIRKPRLLKAPQRGLASYRFLTGPKPVQMVIIYPLHCRGEKGAMGPQVGAQKLGLPGRDSAEGMGTLSI